MNEDTQNSNYHFEISAPGEVIIRHGEAPEVHNHERLGITGTITAPGKWLEIRKSNAQTDHVLFDRDKCFIRYIYNERFPEGGEIFGVLSMFSDLQAMNINSKATFTLKNLATLLKFSRIYFPDKEQHAAVISKLMNFTASVSTQLEQSSDLRGNAKNLRDKKVETNVPVEFKLNIPLYVGEGPKTFMVEVCFDTTDGGGTTVWLESVELAELLISERDRIMDAELAKFTGLVLVEQ